MLACLSAVSVAKLSDETVLRLCVFAQGVRHVLLLDPYSVRVRTSSRCEAEGIVPSVSVFQGELQHDTPMLSAKHAVASKMPNILC